MNEIKENHVLFSGYAKLPAGITASELYRLIGIIVVVDVNTGVVMKADCTMATELARQHVISFIEGYNLNDGPDKLQETFEKVYQGGAKKAIVTVIRIIYDKYRSHKLENSSN